jgi:putative transposase
MKSFKFRIYPNRQQVQILEQTIETCRLLYNESLEERSADKGLKYYEQKRRLTQKRKTVDALKNVHSQVLQNVLLRLERAFQNYHRDRNVGQPNFKRHGRYNSITYPQYGSFCIEENKLKLAFVDGLIRLRLHRDIKGVIKTCTIIRDIDRWFACFSCDSNRKKIANNITASVDVGIHNWIKLDNGELIDRPRFLDAAIENIKRLQREKEGFKESAKSKDSTSQSVAESKVTAR